MMRRSNRTGGEKEGVYYSGSICIKAEMASQEDSREIGPR